MGRTIAGFARRDKGAGKMDHMRAPAASLLVFLLAAAPSAFAAPPVSPRDEGDGAIHLRSSTFVAGWAYDDEGVPVDATGFAKETVAAEVEVGVAPRLTLGARLPFVWIPERDAPTPGDVVLGGAISLLEPKSPVDLALSLDVKLPFYEAKPSVRGRNPVDGLPAIGDGQVDLDAAMVLVSSLPLGGAIQLWAGYRFRTGDVTDAIIGGGRAGLWLLDKRFFASLLLDSVVTLDPGDDHEIVGAGSAAFGPRVSVRLVDKTFLEVTALYVGRGTNAPGGVDLGFGLSLAF
jgi:hypothetical protein